MIQVEDVEDFLNAFRKGETSSFPFLFYDFGLAGKSITPHQFNMCFAS
jgi:hypothetical protein